MASSEEILAADHFEVRRASAEETYELRRVVLRPHQAIDELASEDDASSQYFVAVAGDKVIATAVLVRSPVPVRFSEGLPAAPAQFRLRAMATLPEWRSRGVGAAMMRAVIGEVAQAGGGVLWCSARVRGMSFYKLHGFFHFGEPWLEPMIGPHIYMWRRVERAAVT